MPFGVPISSSQVFPDWKSNTLWSDYKTAKTNLIASLGQNQTVTSYNFPASFTAAKNEGLLAHPNGYIYGCPTNRSVIVRFDPATNTTVLITTPSQGYLLGAVAPNGKIYYVGYTINAILVYDPSVSDPALAFYQFAVGGFSTAAPNTRYYNGGVLSSNGNIYVMPGTIPNILVIVPGSAPGSQTGDSFYTIGSFTTTGMTTYCAGGSEGPDGKIYGAIFDGTLIPVIGNLSGGNGNETVTFPFSAISGTAKYASIVLSSYNEKFYCMPYTAGTKPLKIDPIAVTAITFGSNSTGGYGDGLETLDGKLAYCPQNSTHIGIIDPTNDTYTETVGSFTLSPSDMSVGSAMDMYGRAIFGCYNALYVAVLGTKKTNQLNYNVFLSRFVNKY